MDPRQPLPFDRQPMERRTTRWPASWKGSPDEIPLGPCRTRPTGAEDDGRSDTCTGCSWALGEHFIGGGLPRRMGMRTFESSFATCGRPPAEGIGGTFGAKVIRAGVSTCAGGALSGESTGPGGGGLLLSTPVSPLEGFTDRTPGPVRVPTEDEREMRRRSHSRKRIHRG